MPSNTLFHYTTGDGLAEILRSQTLRATHSEFLNDPSECKALKTVLTPVFKKELEELVPVLVEKGIVKQSYLSDLGRAIYATEADNIFDSFAEVTSNLTPFFITSFCQHDSASSESKSGLLSQWRAYAKGGFAIEFDLGSLDKLAQKEKQKYIYSGIKMKPVQYFNHETYAAPQTFSGVAKILFRNMLLEKNKDIDVSFLTQRDNLDDYFEPFVSVAPFLKDPGFKEECEFRFVAIPFAPGLKNEGEKRLPKRIDFKVRSNGVLAPFISLFEGLDEKLPIRSVIVGPHPYQETQRRAVHLMLKQCGIDADVRLSNIPYRD